MQILFQVIVIILGIIAVFQREKWSMMLVYTINNVFTALMYFSFFRIASGVISIIGAIRTFIFMLFAVKNIKPNIHVLVIFEFSFLFSTIFTWKDALDLLPMFAVMIAGFASWQNNEFFIRLGYLAKVILFIAYQVFIGAYIAIFAQAIVFVSTFISIIYYKGFNCKK